MRLLTLPVTVLVTVLATGLLAACASPPETPSAAPAATLTLHTPLRIPAEAATVRLQEGHPVARQAVREHDPFCIFEIDSVSEAPQTVMPDTFRIVRIAQTIDTLAQAGGAAQAVKAGLFDDVRPTFIYYKTLFRLRSDTQPGVRLLTCLSNQNLPGVYPFMRHLTLEEIRAALGTQFTLTLRAGVTL